MTTSPNAANITSRRPWWNFTLRELLLLMVAVGACFALFRKEFYSRQPSPLIYESDLYESIKGAVRENSGGISFPFVSCNGRAGASGYGIGEIVGDCHIRPEVSLPRAFGDILKETVREKILESGCRIDGDGSNGEGSVHFKYRYRNNVGLLTVIYVPGNASVGARIYFTCFEVSRSAN